MVFHAFGCHTECFCDLFVRFVFVATHDEDTAGLFRQGGQCLVHDFLCFGCKQFFRIAGFEGGDAGVQFPFGMILQMFAGIFPDLYMLQVVDTFVFDDREYIGRNIGICLNVFRFSQYCISASMVKSSATAISLTYIFAKRMNRP